MTKVRDRLLRCSVAIGIFSIATEAVAQETATSTVSTDVPSVNRQHTLREPAEMRDGLFVRFGFGMGGSWYHAHFDGKKHWSAQNQGLEYLLQIGGTVARGLVLGGGAVLNSMGNATVKGRAESEPEFDFFVAGQLQAFATYYPIHNEGLSVFAAVGYTAFTSRFASAGWSDDATGFSLTSGVGYDFTISPHWSMGPLLSVSYAVAAEAGPFKFNSATLFTPTGVLAVTYY